MKPHLLFLLLAVSFPVASACGRGNDELERALKSMAEDDLAVMVLTQEELGAEFADLELAEPSGFQDNEDEASTTVDPYDKGADLTRAGRMIGYELAYTDQSGSALEAGEGLLLVFTEVELLADSRSASEYAAQQVDDQRRFLEEVETFPVEGLGDGAVGLRARSALDARIYRTRVIFSLGRLVGWAGISRADEGDVNSLVEEIARMLKRKIEGVLLGEVAGTSVPRGEARHIASGVGL